MVSGKQVCRYQDMSKESQTRAYSVRIVWQIEAQKKSAFVRVVSVQAKPRLTFEETELSAEYRTIPIVHYTTDLIT